MAEARAERDMVNATFLKTSNDMEQSKKGFGVNFWGSSWRFRMMEEFYIQPGGSTGRLLRCNERYNNLKRRLAEVRDGVDTWVFDVIASDPKIRSEIANPAAVGEFCGLWLASLAEHEARPQRTASGGFEQSQ